MISSADAVCFGETTDTGGRAVWAVSAFRVVRALTRDQMPDIKRAATASSAIARASRRLRGEFPTATLFNGTVCPPIVSSVPPEGDSRACGCNGKSASVQRTQLRPNHLLE